MKLDQALRQHAQLASAVQRVGGLGRLDDLLRELTQALLGAHGGRAQKSIGIVIRHLARLHQDALCPVHGLALFKAGA